MVLVGGGYWLHYLMGLVPGLVVLAAAVRPGEPSPYPLAGRGVRLHGRAPPWPSCCWVLVHPIERPEEPAIAYLDEHARPGDTAVVAFGAPNILQGAGLQSPYPQLWSLPARVRDPQARELADVLDRAGGADLAGRLRPVGEHLGHRRRGGEPHRPLALRAGGETPATSGSTSGRSARDRGPRRRPSPDAHAPRARAAAMAGFAALLVRGAW